MLNRGYNANLEIWSPEQADALNQEFIRPHPSCWNDEVSITAAIISKQLRIAKLPMDGNECIITGCTYGTGVYDAGGAETSVLIIPQVVSYTITQPNTVSFIALLAAVNTTATAPVPPGNITWFTYNDFVNAAIGDYTITTAPKIKFRMEMK